MDRADDRFVDGDSLEYDTDDKPLRRMRAKRHFKQRRVLDLTIIPPRNVDHLAAKWRFQCSTDITSLFNQVRDAICEVLCQRQNILDTQLTDARRALFDTECIVVRRYRRHGLLFRWKSPDRTMYWVSVRERDPITIQLDDLQYRLSNLLTARCPASRPRKLIKLGAA